MEQREIDLSALYPLNVRTRMLVLGVDRILYVLSDETVKTILKEHAYFSMFCLKAEDSVPTWDVITMQEGR